LLSLIFFLSFYNLNYYFFNKLFSKKIINNVIRVNISASLYNSFLLLTKKDFFLSIVDFFLFKKQLNVQDFYNLYNNYIYTKSYLINNNSFNININYSGLQKKKTLNAKNFLDNKNTCKFTFFLPKTYFLSNENSLNYYNIKKILPNSSKDVRYLSFLYNYIHETGLNVNSFLKVFLKFDYFNYYYCNKIIIYINNNRHNIKLNKGIKVGDIIKISFDCLNIKIYFNKIYKDFLFFSNKYLLRSESNSKKKIKSALVNSYYDSLFVKSKLKNKVRTGLILEENLNFNNKRKPSLKKFSRGLDIKHSFYVYKSFDVNYYNNIYIYLDKNNIIKFNFFLKNFINLYSYRLYF